MERHLSMYLQRQHPDVCCSCCGLLAAEEAMPVALTPPQHKHPSAIGRHVADVPGYAANVKPELSPDPQPGSQASPGSHHVFIRPITTLIEWIFERGGGVLHAHAVCCLT